MRRITFLFLSYLLVGFCYAQTETTETFESDGGFATNDENAVVENKDGKLIIKNKSKDTFIMSEKDLGSVSENSDFMASLLVGLHKISYSGGENQYGMSLSNSDNSSSYVLALKKDTTYAIVEIVGGDTVKYTGWMKHYIVKPELKQNLISIIKENKKVYYQINGYTVHKADYRGEAATKVNLLTGIKSCVAFDSLYAMTTGAQEVQVYEGDKTVSAEDYELKNLGANVNSCYTEILPRLSVDGSQLYTTRMDHPNNVGAETNSGDIWVSAANDGEASEDEDMDDSDWMLSENLGEVVNNDDEGNTDFIISFAPDGNSMYLKGLYGDYAPIYVSEKDGDNWTTPEPMVVDSFYNFSDKINIATNSDRTVAIFSIERLDSKGGRDLFYTQLQGDSLWSKPENLGDVVNSYGEDITPFLAADDRTLYFSTDGKAGYGGYDIFVTERQGDSWTEWSEPKNLGEFYNSEQDDRDYYIPHNSEETEIPAYLSSSVVTEGAFGGLDIYAVVPSGVEEPVRRGVVAGMQININFDFDKSDIRQDDFQELDAAILALNANGLSIEVSGHTDGLGGKVYNQKLSERRAESVYNYLTRSGLDIEKVKAATKGYGKEYPCDTNSTDEGRFQNRRVLMVVLGTTPEGKEVNSYLDVHQEGNCLGTSFPETDK